MKFSFFLHFLTGHPEILIYMASRVEEDASLNLLLLGLLGVLSFACGLDIPPPHAVMYHLNSLPYVIIWLTYVT